MGNRIVLRGMGGPVDGLQWEATERLRIGRAPTSDVVLNHPSISREHADLHAGPGGWVLRDLGSANGSFVNGAPVGQTPRHLKVEDAVQCGELGFKVAELEVAARPAAAQRPLDIKTTGEMVRVQAFAQRSWEQALDDLCETNHRLEQGNHFLTLIRAGHHLSRINSLPRLLQTLLDDIVAVLDAQWGAIALVDENRELALKTVSGPSDKPQPGRCYSKTLAQRCFNKGESLLCADAAGLEDLQQSASVYRGRMASIICAVLRSPRRRLGILHLDRGPQQQPFTQQDFLLVDAIAANISVGIESAQGLQTQRDQFLREISGLARMIIEGRHPELGRHGQNVAGYALLIADALKLSEEEKQVLQTGALFHDIGKIALPDTILHKQGPWTAAEQELLRAHPVTGAAIAETISCLQPAAPIIRHHHERWDGGGYPQGLAGPDIPLSARIVAVADALDHLTCDQAASRSPGQCLQSISVEKGRHFDPQCVEAAHILQL